MLVRSTCAMFSFSELPCLFESPPDYFFSLVYLLAHISSDGWVIEGYSSNWPC